MIEIARGIFLRVVCSSLPLTRFLFSLFDMSIVRYVEIYNNVFHNLLEGVDRARDDDSATSKNKQV